MIPPFSIYSGAWNLIENFEKNFQQEDGKLNVVRGETILNQKLMF